MTVKEEKKIYLAKVIGVIAIIVYLFFLGYVIMIDLKKKEAEKETHKKNLEIALLPQITQIISKIDKKMISEQERLFKNAQSDQSVIFIWALLKQQEFIEEIEKKQKEKYLSGKGSRGWCVPIESTRDKDGDIIDEWGLCFWMRGTTENSVICTTYEIKGGEEIGVDFLLSSEEEEVPSITFVNNRIPPFDKLAQIIADNL